MTKRQRKTTRKTTHSPSSTSHSTTLIFAWPSSRQTATRPVSRRRRRRQKNQNPKAAATTATTTKGTTIDLRGKRKRKGRVKQVAQYQNLKTKRHSGWKVVKVELTWWSSMSPVGQTPVGWLMVGRLVGTEPKLSWEKKRRMREIQWNAMIL